jgi:drug/metabolite transporter (DMT)-like permease
LLVGRRGTAAETAIDPVGALVLVLAALSWAYGSLRARRASLPASPFPGTGMQMLLGGAWLVAAGTVRGEWSSLDLALVSTRSLVAWVYLLVFGSLVGFTAYIYLLGVTTPARVSTYGFVNPLVAVLLGWALAGEPLGARTLFAAAVILSGVVLIVTSGSRRNAPQAGVSLDAAARARV